MGFDVTRIPEELYIQFRILELFFISLQMYDHGSSKVSNDSELGFYNIHDYN